MIARRHRDGDEMTTTTPPVPGPRRPTSGRPGRRRPRRSSAPGTGAFIGAVARVVLFAITANVKLGGRLRIWSSWLNTPPTTALVAVPVALL